MVPEKLLDEAALAATLAQYDVYYLRTATKANPLPINPPDLIAALAQHSDPRLHEALIPLFLRHPEFAVHVPHLVDQLPSDASRMLSHLYTAAVYLQRLWRSKLEMYLGPHSLLPDCFGESEWQLPPPDEHFGEAGLRVLGAKLHSLTGYNWLSTYQTVMSTYLKQLRMKFNG
jgi:hypothetical protein